MRWVRVMKFVLLLMLCSCSAWGASVDVAISLSAPTGPVSVSSNLVYAIIVTNAGAVPATGVAVRNDLAANVNFVSATSSQGTCSHSAGVVSCNLGNLNAGAAATISIRGQPTAQGWSETRADVSANQADSAPENNSAWSQTLVGLMDLGLTISDVPETVVAAETVTYMLTVTNHGPDPTPGGGGVELRLPTVGADGDVILAADMSAGTFESGGYYYLWLFPVLPAGGSVTLTLQIWLVSGLNYFQIYAASLGGPHDPNASNNTISDYVTVAPGRGILQFAQVSQDAFERSGSAQIQLNRTGGAIGAVQVDFATEDGTATSGDDYTGANRTVTFADGETKKIISVSLFQHSQFECARNFKARLFNAGGGAILGPKTKTTLTLFDDDILPQGTTECISVSYSNSVLAEFSDRAWLTDDGRILFQAAARNWLTNTDPDYRQIFLRDPASGTTRLITANYENTGGSLGFPEEAVMSSNERYVAFTSDASDLATNAVIGWRDVFVRDLVAEKTELVSVSADGASGGNDYSHGPIVSSNGMVIAFNSSATNFVPDCQCEGYGHIFARDLTTGVTRLVTKGFTEPANGHSTLGGLNAAGRFVLFWSDASNLVVADTNGQTDVFVRDLLTETTLLVSVNVAGIHAGNASSFPQGWPRITPDGRFVVFDSDASDLVPEDTNEVRDVFIRDLLLGTTRLVSINQVGSRSGNGYSAGSSVTPDGRYIAFYSDATDLVAATYVRPNNIFVRDLQNNTTVLASANCEGKAVGSGGIPTISRNGKYVVFISVARDLVSGAFPLSSGGSALWQVYRRDLASGTTALVSANYEYTGGGNADSGEPMISADGKSILFADNASDLTMAQDINASTDIFLWRELPEGVNAEVRITGTVNSRPSIMVITLAVTNFGPDTATDAIVQDALSAAARFITASTTAGSCAINGGQVTCSIGTLSRRAGAVVTLVATPTGNGPVAHTATVSSSIPDPLQANNAVNGSAELLLPPSATLWISRCKPQTFVQWLSAPPEFQLESGVLNGWSPVSSAVLDNGILKTHIIDNGNPAVQFYRLRRP